MLLRRGADTRQTQADTGRHKTDTRQVRGLKKHHQSGYKKIYAYAKIVFDRNTTSAKITANNNGEQHHEILRKT